MHPHGKPRFRALANSAPADGGLAAIANGTAELAEPDAAGWMLISRYGDWPNGGLMQRVDRASARAMVNAFQGALARVKRIFSGANAEISVYFGHPDAPSLAGEGHEDQNVYGRIAELADREDGLWGRFRWNDLGNALRGAGRKLWFSPHWMGAISEKMFHPRRLISVGMVEDPAIPGAAANAAPKQQPENESTMTPAELAELCLALGLANNATPAQVLAAVRKAGTDLAAANTARTSAETALTNEKSAHADTEKARKAAVDKTTAADAALANARKDLAGVHVDRGIEKGQIVAASRDAEIAALCNAADFPKAVEALGKRDVVVKVNAKSADLGKRRGEAHSTNAVKDAEAKFTALVNERMEKGQAYNAAWAAVKASAEGAALWEKMSAQG